MDVLADPDSIRLLSPRLLLRPALPADAPRVQRYHLDNRQHLQPWQPLRPEGYFEIDAISARLHSVEQQRLAGACLHLLVCRRESGEMVGECNVSNIVLGAFDACHLGYSLAGHAQGQVLMTEALKATIHYLFNDLQLHRIMANYRPQNTRSARVLEGLGFEREGFARAYLRINGVWADHVLTSLLNPAHL